MSLIFAIIDRTLVLPYAMLSLSTLLSTQALFIQSMRIQSARYSITPSINWGCQVTIAFGF